MNRLERVTALGIELNELRGRHERLQAFLTTAIEHVSPQHYDLLVEQSRVMAHYIDILTQRSNLLYREYKDRGNT